MSMLKFMLIGAIGFRWIGRASYVVNRHMHKLQYFVFIITYMYKVSKTIDEMWNKTSSTIQCLVKELSTFYDPLIHRVKYNLVQKLNICLIEIYWSFMIKTKMQTNRQINKIKPCDR